ncbi:GH25 family lysozyme [Saccharopolyspora gloriosae]|uniref:GH25 family lysozyme n=1 Tax=Saccharopolyspora gloriosae TaxID=455344 RepID=UPI001FB6E044|nr:GH25 family lysozyme [Saccharopolyspora gloriosae]
MTPPDRHQNPERGHEPQSPTTENRTSETPQTASANSNAWRDTALGADHAVRSGVDRVRPYAHQVWQRILPILRRLWLAVLPLLQRVRNSTAGQWVEQRVGPAASSAAAKVQGATESNGGGHRSPANPRLRAMQAGAGLAVLGVLGVAVLSVSAGSDNDVRAAAQVDDIPAAGQESDQGSGGLFGSDSEPKDSGPVPGPPAKGIDVSNHNGSVDWKQVAASGQNFAFVLASDGTDFTSPKYSEQYHGAKDAGLMAAPYHFARPDESAEAQADKLLSVADYKKDGKSLPPVLDLEVDPSGGGCYGLSVPEMHKWTDTFNKKVKDSTGADPIIYANPSFWNECMGGSDAYADHPLWLAAYEVDEPTVPKGFKDWNFWQYTEEGSVPGVSGEVDQNHFQGSVGDLAKLGQD